MIELARQTDDIEQFHTLGLDLYGSLTATGGVGAVLASTTGNDTFNYFYDKTGNVVATSDNTGTIRNKINYSPFGEVIWKSPDVPFTFSTKTVDSSGLAYYGFRFYNPELGRWPSRDPIAIEEFGNEFPITFVDSFNQDSATAKSIKKIFEARRIPSRKVGNDDCNLFQFANNNPINKYDYIGLMCSPSDCSEDVIIKKITSIKVTVSKYTGYCGGRPFNWPTNEELAKAIEDAFKEAEKSGEKASVKCSGSDPDTKCPCSCENLHDVAGTTQKIDKDAIAVNKTCTLYYHITAEMDISGKIGDCLGGKK
jgi:RHS repeat-associated protein